MSSRVRWVILGFALAGLALSIASSYVHYRLLTDPTYVSPCSINQTFNCTQVYLSRFGSVRGVPVALGGVIWFTLVLLVAGQARPRVAGAAAIAGPSDEAPDVVGTYLFVLATVGLAVILYLGYASFIVLKTACLFCMGTYVCVLGIFIASGLTTSMGVMKLPQRLAGDLRRVLSSPVTLVLTVLYITGAASLVAFFPKEGGAPATAAAPIAPAVPQSVESQFADLWNKQPRTDLGIPAGTAKVVVVKFNDWMCPACKGYAQLYQPVLDKYNQTDPGSVKFVIKDWTWNADCNFNVPRTVPGHELSCNAAAAVRMARDKGKADEMIAWIFANQERLVELGQNGPQGLAEIKAKVKELTGLTDYDRAYAEKIQDVKRDIADGGVLQVGATPTFFINGVRTTDRNGQNLSQQYFDLAIKLELKKASH